MAKKKIQAGRRSCKRILLFFFSVQLYLTSAGQVTEIYTDFGGYWKSTTTVINPVVPNNSHNVIAFTSNSVTYSTGVNNAILTSNGVTFTPANFKALPITSIGGAVTSGSSTYIALGTLYDGVANGYGNPLLSLRMIDVLTDGVNGLNIGTGVTNIPATALLNFPISGITTSAIGDGKPDILFSQTAQPSATVDTLYFLNSSAAVVGNKVAVAWTSVTALGAYSCDLYSLSNTSCDAATITGGNQTNQPKDIRLVSFELSDFGITGTNASSVVKLVLKPGGTSDPAFVAYNSDAFSILSPVITTQPQSQIICPATSQNAIFTVVATGAGLNYQWKKNGVVITGATSATYTILNVSAGDAGMYEVDITNSGGTVTSSIAYLNTAITSQPTPSSQTIATGNSITLSVSSTYATGFQWKKNGTDISGATATTYTINPLTASGGGNFTVNVINSASSGCASILSTTAVITASVTLFVKSSGNLNVAANWGVNTDGSGSTPVDFTRSEHTFKISNQAAASTGANLTIAGTLDLASAVTTITPGTTLNAARIIRSGAGTISGSSTSNLTVSGISDVNFTAGSQLIKNLTINGGTVTLNTLLDITAGSAAGILTVNAGTFKTSDSLTLKSDVNGTAQIANSPGIINGKITIERFMPARRAWRLMAAPISATAAPTINVAWQEGATSSVSNPNPGFGTYITGGTIANGFDQSPTNNSSLKYFNGSNWVTIANTFTTLATQYPGYMFFVRGNRSYNISTTLPSTTPITTVLRMKGNVNQGTQAAKVIAASGYTLAGNPYVSPIDFSLVAAASSNLKNRFWMWDPQLGGTNGTGAYVLLDWNGSSYTATPSAALNGIIQAGQAFFLQSNDGATAGSMVIAESHKSSATTIIPFGRQAAYNSDATIALDLKILNADSTISTADGVLARYKNGYNNAINNDDALKFTNGNENLSIISQGHSLSVERRSVPCIRDTIHLKITGLKNTHYELVISLTNFASTGLRPLLYDKFRNTLFDIQNYSSYPFNITEDMLSGAADRFVVIFKGRFNLPQYPLKIEAAAYDNALVTVKWKTGNEINISHYEIQKSEAGNFVTIGREAAKNVAGETSYQYNDQHLITKNNSYRIKEVDVNGDITYSAVVNVTLTTANGTVAISPNPVTGNVILLAMNGVMKGRYQYTIVGVNGQNFLTGFIEHNNGEPFQSIKLFKRYPTGNYTFLLNKDDTFYSTAFIIKNE